MLLQDLNTAIRAGCSMHDKLYKDAPGWIYY
jgi:hypothetical protein